MRLEQLEGRSLGANSLVTSLQQQLQQLQQQQQQASSTVKSVAEAAQLAQKQSLKTLLAEAAAQKPAATDDTANAEQRARLESLETSAKRTQTVASQQAADMKSRLIMVESQTTQALADGKLAASGLEQLLSGSRKREADAAELRSSLEQQSHAIAQSRQLQAAELQKLHAQLNELREAGGSKVDDSSRQAELTAAAQAQAQAAAAAQAAAQAAAMQQPQPPPPHQTQPPPQLPPEKRARVE